MAGIDKQVSRQKGRFLMLHTPSLLASREDP